MAIASTLLFGGVMPAVHALPTPYQISQNQDDWNAIVNVARLVNADDEITDLLLQVNVLNKPSTSYANVVYQVFANNPGSAPELVYNSVGARLISNNAGTMLLPTEVISLDDLTSTLEEKDIDLDTANLEVMVQIRYDEQGGARDQSLEWRSDYAYQSIALTTSTTNIATATSTYSNTSGFTLSILQPQETLTDGVIARVSVKERTTSGFTTEKFVGDFWYEVNEQARFVEGLEEGDRVVVRLFTPENQLIGYSEFDVLSAYSLVNLVLSRQVTTDRIVRTVYGIDADIDGNMDATSTLYDYFTQLTGSGSSAQVTFLNSTSSITKSLFEYTGLPAIASTCFYTSSFLSGNYSLVSRTVSVFSSGLSPVLTASPGQLVQSIYINSSSLSVYEISRLIVAYQEVDYSSGSVVVIDEDEYEVDEDYGRPQHCNQGIGNGAEGCDPGNSHPHGGSNDEGGRTPPGHQ
jgi:hypothetical protein